MEQRQPMGTGLGGHMDGIGHRGVPPVRHGDELLVGVLGIVDQEVGTVAQLENAGVDGAAVHRGLVVGQVGDRTVAYLPDHQAPVDRRTVDPGVLELCDGADLLIHDAQYTDEEFVTMSDWGHSTVAYAVHVAAEAGAHRLSLFHHDPSHTDKEIDRMLSRARRLAAQYRLDDVTAASEGWTIDLGK